MRERFGQCGMSMAKARDRYPGEEIDVGVAVGVGEGRAFAVVERDPREQRNPLPARRDIALFGVEDFLRFGPGDGSFDCR